MLVRSTIKKNDTKNKGGFFGGLNYAANSTLAGIGGGAEGIADLFTAPVHALAGNTEYAKYVLKDNKVGDWHASITEEYNPDAVWKFVGDVAHGLGQSSWFLLNLIPGANWVGTAAFGAGMVGQGISNAAEQTGDVGLKEVAYGVSTAAIETTLGHFLSGTSTLAKNIGGSIAKSTGKSALKSVASSATRKGLVKSILTDAAGEFAEEFISEYTDTFLQRLYQINPDAETSLRDAIYSGFVGAVSGAVSAGAGDVINATVNQQKGADIIKRGNSQTLVNTATKVADQLAAAGTDFKNAPQWVKTLRGEVDAYNKLAAKGQQESLSAQTILGEMQASLYFAETQAQVNGVQHGIMNADEADRAVLAEYINQSFDKSKRKKDYTADDIAKNTDDVATQLAILKYVKVFDIDGAVTEAEIEAKIAEEQGKATARAEQKSTESAPAMANEAAQRTEAQVQNAESGVQGEVTAEVPVKYELKKDSSGNTYVDVDESLVKDTDSPKQIALTLSEVVRNKFNDFVDVKGQKIGINQKTANEWVKSRDASSLLRLDKSKFIDKANAFGNADELLQAAKNYIGEEIKHARKDSFVEFARGVVDFKVGNNGYSADIIVGTTKSGAAVLYDIVNIQNKKIVTSESDTAQDRRHETPVTNNSIPQTEAVVNTEGRKNITKADLVEDGAKKAQVARKVAEGTEAQNAAETSAEKKDDGKAAEKVQSAEGGVQSEEKEKSSERQNEASQSGEPKISEAKESLTDEQRKEKARKRAEQMIEWEKKNAPTVKELNSAREYVKGFDNLSQARKASIVRMIRSADGKVDTKTLKGVANLIAAMPRADVEIRFTEGLGGDLGGFYAPKVGGKALIVIDSSTNFKKTIQGTIAHELVHHLEKNAGYKEFAKFVMSRVKPEKKAEVEKRYTEFYTDKYTAEAKAKGMSEADAVAYVKEKLSSEKFKSDVESEVVAKYVGQALNNEKLLKKYADKDKKFIAKVGDWLFEKVKTLKKNKEKAPEGDQASYKETIKVADDMAFRVSVLLQETRTAGESTGETKYDLDEKKPKQLGKDKITNEDRANDESLKKAVERSKDEEQKRKEKEKKAKEAVEALFLNEVRTYTKTDFRNTFSRAGEIAENVIGEILNGRRVSISGADLTRVVSDVYIAMYKASYDGDVGAVDAVKKIADKAAAYFIKNQAVWDSDTKQYVSLTKYIEDADTLKKYEEALAEEYFKAFADAGRDLKNYRSFATVQKASEDFKRKYFDFKEIEKYKKRASNEAMDLKQLANMQKRSAADEGVRLLAKAMGDTVDKHGMIRTSKIDAALAQASDFYNQETNVKFFGDEEIGTLTDHAVEYDRGAREKIDKLLEMRKERQGKPLTAKEMELWSDILGVMRKTINQYNALYKDGKYFDRTKTAMDLANDILGYHGFNTQKKFDNKLKQLLYDSQNWVKHEYFYSVLTPETVIEGLEGYAHRGILKSFYHSVRDATQIAEKMRAELLIPFAEFFESKDNAWEDTDGKIRRKYSYSEKLNRKKIDLFGTELELGEAIYLYGITKREHAQAGLAKEGIKIYGEDGRLKKHIREIDAERTREWLYKQFDDTDKKYIKMVEEFFNKTSTEIKSQADIEYLGYTNTIDSYYIPILRDRFSRDRRTTDRRSSIADITTVYNEKFNQHVVQNAKTCEVTNIQQIVSTHAKGLADYANLYMPLKSFDRLYNSPVVLEDGRKTTIRELVNDVWPDADNYFSDLFGDIQGRGRETGRYDTLNKMAQGLTNKWVPSVLSANPSVILNQTTSYLAAAQVIEEKYLVKAFGAIGGNMKELGARADKYSKIILARSFEEGAIRSQTNVDKVGEVGKVLGKGIEWTDRQICLLIFHAAEIKAEEMGKGAIGTEQNAEAAAKIADKTIQDTQSMTSPAERGAWQRSPNLFAKSVTQFMSDGIKQFSHLYSNVAKYIAHQSRVKAGDTSYEADLAKDRKAIGRSVATIGVTSAWMAAVAWIIRLAFNTTEDEPEEEVKNVARDMVGNVIGIMPFVSDIYSLAVDGYEITLTSMDIINDVIKYVSSTANLAVDAASGKDVSNDDIVKMLKNNAVVIGGLTGIPVSPLLKTTTGIFRRISPSLVYWYDSALSYNTYREDIDRAIAIGDEKLAQVVLEMKYQEEATGTISDAEIAEILRLYQLKDENGEFRSEVLPSSIPSEITTRKQRDKFEKIYGESSGAVAMLINSLEYKNLTDEERIKAIQNTYKLYLNKAKTEVLGDKITSAQAYAMLLDDTSNLFLAQARKSSLEPKKDQDGKEISIKDQLTEYLAELEVEDNERLIIEYALGYKSKENKAKIIAYINSLNLSEEAKKQIAERLGFEIKNGIVVQKTEE